MRSSFLTAVFLAAGMVQGQANFTTNWNPMGEGCVDTAGFLGCYSTQSTKASSCQATCAANNKQGTSQYNTCNDACETAQLGDNVGCWIQSCWNQVHSCAYQLTALSYFNGVGIAQDGSVPFYPPPGDATAGACSCNLGYVYGNLSAISTSTQGSNCQVIAGGDNTTYYDCECCSLSWPISNILNVCPTSDLSGIYFANGVSFPTYLSRVAEQLTPSADKCAILNNDTSTCISNYNFPYVGNHSYNPLAVVNTTVEANKTALSNSAGNAYTVFPNGQVNLTLTLRPSYTSTISPASFAASASADPQSLVGTSIMGGTTTSSSSVRTTMTSASASPTETKKSAGVRREGSVILAVVFGMVVGAVGVC